MGDTGTYGNRGTVRDRGVPVGSMGFCGALWGLMGSIELYKANGLCGGYGHYGSPWVSPAPQLCPTAAALPSTWTLLWPLRVPGPSASAWHRATMGCWWGLPWTWRAEAASIGAAWGRRVAGMQASVIPRLWVPWHWECPWLPTDPSSWPVVRQRSGCAGRMRRCRDSASSSSQAAPKQPPHELAPRWPPTSCS